MSGQSVYVHIQSARLSWAPSVWDRTCGVSTWLVWCRSEIDAQHVPLGFLNNIFSTNITINKYMLSVSLKKIKLIYIMCNKMHNYSWKVYYVQFFKRMGMFYLTMHSTYFIYSYIVKAHPVREETCCHHYMGCPFWLAARDLLYAPSHTQDSTYHSLR